jgi:uncharacterized protein with GYD domain
VLAMEPVCQLPTRHSERDSAMSKYLFRGSYTDEGLRGLMQEGGGSRSEAARQVIESVGGMLEVFYFAFGDDDFILITEMPDAVSATAASLVVNASGAMKVKTVVLLSPEEVDEATNLSATFRPPGQ